MSDRKQNRFTTKRLVISALFVALAVVLNELTPIKFPFGGGVTAFSQVPIVLLSFCYGVPWGLVCGALMGIINMLFGLVNFSYVSGIGAYLVVALFDYIIAFGGLGLAGMFRKVIKNKTVSIAVGAGVVSLIRYACHFISGVTVWADYADGWQSVWGYSLSYNGGYMIPELIITIIGAIIIVNIKPIFKALDE